MNQTFLILYQPGSAWIAGQSIYTQSLQEHGQFLLTLYQKRQLRMAGSLGDASGVALVLEAPDETQARRIIDSDPAIVQSVFEYELHTWTLVPWECYPNRTEI